MAIKENFAIFFQEENFPYVSPSSLLSLVLDHFIFFYHSLYHLLLSLDCHQLHISFGFSSDHHRLSLLDRCHPSATSTSLLCRSLFLASLAPINRSGSFFFSPGHQSSIFSIFVLCSSACILLCSLLLCITVAAVLPPSSSAVDNCRSPTGDSFFPFQLPEPPLLW